MAARGVSIFSDNSPGDKCGGWRKLRSYLVTPFGQRMERKGAIAVDPRSTIRSASMTAFQVGIVILCVLIAALDGFDVLAIAYTAPSIAHEWGLSPTNLGLVFSTGPLGMGIGPRSSPLLPIGLAAGRF